MTREELETLLEEHHRWRLAEGYPSEAIQKEETDPETLTEDEILSLTEWRSNPPMQLKLVGRDLSELDLSDLDFTMVVFDNCKLCDCDIRNSIFDNALLKDVCFEGSNLIGASIDTSKMIRIDIGTGCSNLTSSKNLVSKLGSDPNEIYQRALSAEISMLSS
tara:strand:- start:314 stop:799 length:486 start_codon:yes stop_codon:yes gene_type:complete